MTGKEKQPNDILNHFAANIHSMDINTPSRIMHFGAPMLDGEFGESLHVREVALPLWEAIECSGMWGVVVSGAPGIGKSHWLLWLLIRYLT